MKNITLILFVFFVVTACKQNTKATKIQIAEYQTNTDHSVAVVDKSIVVIDKNDPQGILYAFQKFVKIVGAGEYYAVKDLEYDLDKIVDSLSHNYSHNVFVADDTIIYHKKKFEELPSDNIQGLWENSYSLFPEKNIITRISCGLINDKGCEIKEYRLLNFTNTTKFIYSDFFDSGERVYYGETKIYDFNPQSGYFSLDSVSTDLLKVEAKDFFMELTPDSLAGYPYFFSIIDSKKGIAECRLNHPVPWFVVQPTKEIFKWLKGNVIYFDFINGIFTRSEPYFDDNSFLANEE